MLWFKALNFIIFLDGMAVVQVQSLVTLFYSLCPTEFTEDNIHFPST